MMICVLLLALAVLSACAGPAPSNLRAEHQEGPVVIDPGEAPRLSWINETEQSAWQVIVSVSADSFDGSSLVWDSGKVLSRESHLVPYAGPALEPMTGYYWKVRIWDDKGRASAWSEVSRITTGPAPGAWEAEWIGAPWQKDQRGEWYTRYPMFRKEFRLGAGLESARLFISGLGYFEARINGEKVGEDFFAPGFTDYTLRPYLAESERIPLDPAVTAYRTLYLAYDVSEMLREGDNAIGVTLGNGYFHTRPMAPEDQCESYGVPRFIARLELSYEDGHRESICTDTSWKAAESPYVYGDLWGGEVYDAREEQAGWDQAGFDDSAWPASVVRKTPDGPLTANMGPVDRVMETLAPVSFEKQEDGSYRVDFGKVISGRVLLKGIRGAAGDTLNVKYPGEYESPRCQYIFAGDAPVEWGPDFTWFVFREAVISGIADIAPEQVVAQAINSNVPINSTFSCSNPLFDRILESFERAQMDNMHSGVASDCPHRERLPYTGDGEVAQAAVMSFFDAASFYNKWIGEIVGSQNPGSGHVPNTAPWEPMGGGGPAWGAAICVMPWEFYLRYGDRRILEKSLEGMWKYVNYLGTWEREDGTVFVQKTTPDGKPFFWYNLGDWVAPFGDPDQSLVHTFFYWLCARNTALSAKIVGDESLAAEAGRLQNRIREAFHKRFYNPGEKSYGDYGSNVYALYMGVPEERLEDVRKTLRHELEVKYKGHLNTGFIATRYLFETLSLNGMGDLAYTIMDRRDYPGYGWWLEQGATTLWESWNGDASKNHPMFGGALTWYARVLAGVDADPGAPGFKHIIIRPIPSPQLGDVRYSTDTPYGSLSSHVSHDGKMVQVEVSIPAGSSATVYVPTSLAAVTSDPVSDDSYTAYELGPGHHILRSECEEPSDLMSDTWVATDALGRQMPLSEEVGPVKEGRHFTGIFYITWHGAGNHHIPGPYTDVTKILQEDPSARLDASHPLWKYGSYHWGEPEAGYFLSQDSWLMRRDLSMLQDAGIDVLILDVTNGVCYWDEWELLFGTMERMRLEGNRTPQFTFWSYNGNPVRVVSQLYERYYKTGRYKDLWFLWDGRPLLLYNADPSVDANGNYEARKEDYPAEIFDFFTLRNMWWGYYAWGPEHEHDETRYVGTEDNWSFGLSMNDERVRKLPLEDLASKHNGKVEECAVTPAQHPLGMAGAPMGVGKSWTRASGEPPLNEYDLPEGQLEGLGLYFQERWDEALAVDPPFIYINDWNEWTAGKYNFGDTWFLGRENSPFAFVDQYNAEFNRTIQPMKGGYTDNYYMQMAQNIRRYKGARSVPVNRGFRKILIDGSFRDWDKVKLSYRDTRGDTAWRDADGYAGLHYTDSSGRNDIVEAKVALDRKGNVNFYVRTAADISAPEGEDWMLLLLDVDRDASTGWHGYDFLANREPGKLMAWRQDGWVPLAGVEYAVSGQELELSIPMELLHSGGNAVSFDFKWADHCGALDDPMFLNGDAAPNRRFNYRFIWKR